MLNTFARYDDLGQPGLVLKHLAWKMDCGLGNHRVVAKYNAHTFSGYTDPEKKVFVYIVWRKVNNRVQRQVYTHPKGVPASQVHCATEYFPVSVQ